MTTLRGIAQPPDCLLAHMLLAYWRKLLVDTEKQPDEARNGACVAIRDQDIAR